MRALMEHILLSAIRDRLLLGMVSGLIFLGYISQILGYTALVEESESALTFAAGSMRLLLAFGLIIFTCFYVQQAMQNREIALLLSRPLARWQLLLAYFTGFFLIASLLTLIVSGILASIGPQSLTGYAAFCISLLAEASILLGFALFAAFSLPSAALATIASIGFYLLSRLMGFFITTLANRPAFTDYTTQQLASGSIDLVALLTPRLDFFGQTGWLHYGAPLESWALFLGQALIYTPFLLCLAVIDLNRKDF